MGEKRVGLLQGSMLDERYRLGPLHSEGEVCRVLDAWDELLQREVAVKTLDGVTGAVVLSRALRAARTAARIDHPHVIRIIDVVQGDPSFLVLERHVVEGLRAPASARERYALADDLLAGLTALHAGNAVHRDVRADNVLRTPDGRVLLTTTGVTAAMRDPELSPSPVEREPQGPPAGSSPEQTAGLPANARSDVYAAGVLLRDLLGDVAGPEVRAVLDRATARDPAARPADAGELREALRQAKPAGTFMPYTPSRPSAPQVKSAPPVSPTRRPPRGALVAALITIAVLGLGLATRQTLTSDLQPAESSPNGQPSAASTEQASPAVTSSQPTSLAGILERSDLTPMTEAEAAVLEEVRDLDRLSDADRATAAADLLGRTVTGAANGELSRGFARGLFEALASEVTLDGVIAMAERDPAAAGPFVDRLRALPGLEGGERAREAAKLFGDTSTGATTGALSGEFRAAATAALLPEVTLDGVIALTEDDPALVGTFVDRLRALPDLEGEERGHEAAALFCDASGVDLPPEFRATASAALLPEVTLDGLITLAEQVPDLLGPDSGAFVDRLRAVRDLEGEEGATAAVGLLADIDAAAPGTNLAPPFHAMAAQVLRPVIAGS